VLAGDPANPNRMWSVNAQPYGRSTTAVTFDGWQTASAFAIGNPSVREFPQVGPADVDFAGGTVLAAGDSGLIMNSVDGKTFFYMDSPLATSRWNAVGLASAVDGAVGGDGGRLVVTGAANSIPVTPVATPVPTPVPTSTPTPPRADTKFTGVKVRARRGRVTVRGKLAGAPSCSGSIAVRARGVTRTAALKPACTFSRSFRLARRVKKVMVELRFAGNTVSKPASRNVTVRMKR
jgi:hypothetical protein